MANSLSNETSSPWQPLCANILSAPEVLAQNCSNEAKWRCARCQLVQYCGRECQEAHWSHHKIDCKSPMRREIWRPQWDVQGRKPTFINNWPAQQKFGGRKYLWGNVPAFDVLKIEENEGPGYSADLALCFAASGDLRNVISSVLGLPEGYKGICTCVVNDKDVDVVHRNVLILLIAMLRPPVQAAELMLHLWYSARLTEALEKAIEELVRPLIADVVEKIKNRRDEIVQSKTWSFGLCSMTVCLTKEQWEALLEMLDTKHSASKAEHERLGIVLNASRKDNLDRHLLNLQPSRRLASIRFRETGILLPYGVCVDAYCKPNPTLFSTNGAWKQPDSADPLSSWSFNAIDESRKHHTIPDHDRYGQLYFSLLQLFKEFCTRVATHQVRFRMHDVNAAELPTLVDKETTRSGFDRIEVSNIADQFYLGVQRTLELFASLLKNPDRNSYAVLVCLFMNACPEMESRADRVKAMQENVKQVAGFFNISFENKPARGKFRMMQITGALDLFRDYDMLFGRYMKELQFGRLGRDVGLTMRVPKEHRIIEVWPLRLKKKFGEHGAQDEFDQLNGSGVQGNERYVEWVKTK